MITRVVSHRWVRPRYSSVLMEITPLVDDGVVSVAIEGREPSATPKTISISSATFESGPFDLIVDSFELVDVRMRLLVPIASSVRFLRFDFIGTIIPVEGTVKHQVYVTVDAAPPSSMPNGSSIGGAMSSSKPLAISPIHSTNGLHHAQSNLRLFDVSASPAGATGGSSALGPLPSHSVDVRSWLGLKKASSAVGAATSPAQQHSTTLAADRTYDGSAGDQQQVPTRSVAELATRYAEAHTVANLREDVRNRRDALDALERQLDEEKLSIRNSMTTIQRQLDDEHENQVRRSGLYQQQRSRLIASLRANIKTPDARGLVPALPHVPGPR